MKRDLTWEQHTEARRDGKPGFPIVEVLWWDARSFAFHWDSEIETKPILVTTVGYLVKETKRVYSLVSMINPDVVGHGIVIPKSCVKSKRFLK